MNLQTLHHNDPDVYYLAVLVGSNGTVYAMQEVSYGRNIRGEQDPQLPEKWDEFLEVVMKARLEWVEWYLKKTYGYIRSVPMDSWSDEKAFLINRTPPVNVQRLPFREPEPPKYAN